MTMLARIKTFLTEPVMEAPTAADAATNVLAEMEAREKAERKARAEQIAKEAREQREYRERINAEATERRARLHAMLDTGGDLVPRLLLWGADFNAMRDEIQQRGMGFDAGDHIQDHLVLPLDFADRLAAMINSADVEWDYSATGMFAEVQKAERPKRSVIQLRTPTFYNGPPPGFTGAWDPFNGRPFEEPEFVDGAGTSVAFLPGA